MDISKQISWFGDRLKEPSTWASLAGIAGLVHLNIDPGLWQHVADVGMAIGAFIAFVLPEKK
jgi:hypothetical protein